MDGIEERDRFTGGDFNTSLSRTDRKTRQKIYKEIDLKHYKSVIPKRHTKKNEVLIYAT